MPAAQASTITYLGEDDATGANWRTSSTAKPAAFNPSGTNVYGSDGYYVGSFAGVSGSPITVQSSLPGYVSGVSPQLTQTYGGTYYSSLNDPSAVSQPTNVGAGYWYSYPGSPTQFDLFAITLSATSDFVLGVIGNTNNDPRTNITQLEVAQTVGGNADTGLHYVTYPTAGIPAYSFFEISGVTGDTFMVSGVAGHEVIGGLDYYGISVTGLTVDSVPEPASFSLLLGLTGATLLRRRQRA